VGSLFKFREIGILLVLLALCIVTAAFEPRFLRIDNLQILSRQIALLAILSVAETLVIVTAGIDLSVGSVVALCGIICAWLIVHGLEVLASILATLAISTVIGIYHGVLITKLGIPPFIVTLGTLIMGRSAAGVITKGWPIDLPQNFSFLGQGQWFGVPIPLIALIIIAIFTSVLLDLTAFGRRLYAIGGNLKAARLSGVKIDRDRILAYALCSLLAGFVGIIIASRLNQGQVNVGETYELFAIAGSVIGGTSLFGGEGSILGAIIGVGILGILDNALVFLEVSPYWKGLVIGSVLILVVTFDIQRRRK
jgi:ribose transport system permease protein